MKKILFVVGSWREKSFNRQLAKKAEALLQGKAEVKYLDYAALPFVNQDKEAPEQAEVARVRAEIAAADGVWIFTPEYNFSYPGHVKNLLDWLSRPVIPMDYATPTCINGKPVALSGAGGKAATAQCRAKLTELLTFIKADVLPEQTGIALQPECWTTDVLLLTDEDTQHLAAEAEAFLKKLNA
ncbi:MAG: NAD(P)H-dependent oxidoreductase [Bacteroidaceae bacterium]|nr:NAD(P)H-dependent oxidoreductase [Bacteroidaceae bacterium]